MAYECEQDVYSREMIKAFDWARLQLCGLIHDPGPGYDERNELFHMTLVFLDAAEMDFEAWLEREYGSVPSGTFVSEWIPKSYSWIV